MESDSAAPLVPPLGWFNPIADFLGAAYWAPNTSRVQAFTTGTAQEVDFLIEALHLAPGSRVLDLGCGPGRHVLEFARRGFECVGVDLSETFIELAGASAATLGYSDRVSFVVGDVCDIEYLDEFDAVICLCQGGFGLLAGAEDSALIARFVAALKPGGGLAMSAFHSYFALRFAENGDCFDPLTGVNHEVATLRNADSTAEHDLWTTCFTAKELTLLATAAGAAIETVSGVTPGDYGWHDVSVERPELLLIARRPRRSGSGAQTH